MSWSIGFIGTPENVSKALKAHSETLNGKSKEEYDLALPHLDGLVSQNSGGEYPLVIKIEANGHAHGNFSSCNTSIGTLNGQLV